jgi:ABC-type antimicrobial peptide transport system permease subunit
VGVIAVLALTNALVVAVRRRGHDLAVLRAMGFTRRQTAGAVVVMALTIVSIGALVGVPVGIAIGSTLWRATAEGAFVLPDPNLPWALIATPALGAVVVAVLAAVLPARHAARRAPAAQLRTE